MRKFLAFIMLTLLCVSSGWADGIQKYTPTDRVTELQDGQSYIVYFAGLPTNQDRTGIAYERGGDQVGFYYQTKKPHNGFATTSNRFLWTVTSAGDENGYYIQNVGTGMYVGSDGRANKNEANKPEVYIHQWKADGVECAGVDVEGVDGTRIANASSSFETEKVWVVKNNASEYWHANQGSFTTWSSAHPVAFYAYDIEEVETVDYTINITGTGTVKCGEDVLTNGQTYTSSKLLSASDFTAEGCSYYNVAIDDINMVATITLTNIDTPDALPTAWNNYNGSNDPTWTQGTSGMVTANTANSASHKYHEWFVNSGDKKGEVTLTFQYTKFVSNGSARLDLSCVEVLNANGTVANSDVHNGYSGNNNDQNTYTISFPEKNTNYILRIWSYSTQNSHGTITYNWLSDDIAAAKALMSDGVGYPTTESAGYAALNAITGESTRAELQSAKTAYLQETTINLPVSGKAYKLNFLHNNADKTKRYIKYNTTDGLGLTTEASEAVTILFTEVDATNHKYIMTLPDGNLITWQGDGNEGFKNDGSTVKGYSTMVANQNDKDDWNLCWFTNQGTSEAELGTIKMISRRGASATSCWVISNAGAWAKANEVSFFQNNGATSALQFEEVEGVTSESEDYADGIEKYTLYTTAKTNNTTYADYFGAGLGKYHFTDKDAAVQTTGYMDAVKACTTLEQERSVVNSIAINLPATGKYYRFMHAGPFHERSGQTKYYNGTNRDDNFGANNIFYLDEGNHLVQYSTGKYCNGTSAPSADASGVTYQFDAAYDMDSRHRCTRSEYTIHASNMTNYLCFWESGGARDLTDDNWASWYIEEVEDMYAVTINDADAYVQTADEVQVKNGGYLYVATAETEVTASDKAGYTVDVVKDTENKTITVTYTEEEEPAELADGYFYIKNAATGNYLVNIFDTESATSTTTLANKETRNNGVWKVTCNEDKDGNVASINLINGLGTSIKVGATSYNTLNIGNIAGSIFFTEGLDGTDDNLTAGAADAASSRWILETIGEPYIFTVDIYKGDANSYVTLQKNNESRIQYALNNGFFVTTESGYIDNGPSSLNKNGYYGYPSVADGSKTLYTNYKQIEGKNYIQEYCFIIDEDVQDLQNKINFAKEKILNHEIGYPKFELEGAAYNAWYWNEIMKDDFKTQDPIFILFAYSGDMVQPSYFADILAAYNIVTQITDINLPTPGNFYIFEDNAKVKKTYYLTENSELLCYDNGQFAQIADNLTTVGYAKVGTEVGEGETFDFMSARTDEKGKPVNFGKVMAWQLGDAPLPSGDGHIYSGWTITKQPAPAIKMNTVASDPNFYTTLYMPQPVIIPEGVIAYSATVEDDKFILHEVATAGQTLAANTPVILSGAQGTEITVATSDEGAKSAESNDLKGTITTMPQAEGTTYYVLSGQGGKIAFYKYNEGNNLKGFKVYYDGTAGSGNSNNFEFVIGGDDDLTGIENATVDSANAPIRDLNGNIITKPIKGQIYIQNGKAIKY